MLEQRALLLHVGDSGTHASPGGGYLLRPGFRGLVIRIRLDRAALGLLHELLRGGLIRTGCIVMGNYYHIHADPIDDPKAKEYFNKACRLGADTACEYVKKIK